MRLHLLKVIQFHFASILSPWNQRALIAGGFGIGTPTGVPSEIAAVVTYGDEHRAAWKAHTETSPIDVEAHETSQPSLPRGREEVLETAPLLTEATPFFHFDLVAALRAVEVNPGQQFFQDETLSMKQVDV